MKARSHISNRYGRELRPNHLKGPPGRQHFNGLLRAKRVFTSRAAEGELQRTPGLQSGQHSNEALGVGRVGVIDPQEDVARPQPGSCRRRSRADDANATAFRNNVDRKMTNVGTAIVLILKLLAGQFNPLHGTTSAGERHQHADRIVGGE